MTISTTFSAVSFRIVLFAILWWVITETATDSWFIGVPVIVLATFASVLLLPSIPLSLSGILRFIPFFLWRSLCGGIDVARRALHPRLPISPEIVAYRWRLPPGLPRVFMANVVSLLPGTLSAELDAEYLHVHVLDQMAGFASELNMVEKHVAQVFALKLMDLIE